MVAEKDALQARGEALAAEQALTVAREREQQYDDLRREREQDLHGRKQSRAQEIIDRVEAMLSQAEPGGDERRRHKRFAANLAVEFARSRERKSYSGRIRDISQGGIRFHAPESVDVGEVLSVTIHNRQRVFGLRATIDTFVQVLRVKKTGKLYEVGAKFIDERDTDFASRERRTWRRRRAEFRVEYRHYDGTEKRLGVVRDVSQGGMRFLTQEGDIPAGTFLVVVAAPGTENSIAERVDGVVRVIRSRPVGDQTEIGVMFLTPH